MKPGNCLYCYKPLEDSENRFHKNCCSKFFGKPIPPELPYSEEDLMNLGLQLVKSKSTVTGVQPKLSLDVLTGKSPALPPRLTIVGLLGRYILKPQSEMYKHLPEVEDLTMHMAELCGISTVPHSLIPMKSGRLAYISRRIDRQGNQKISMEDMCQLTGRLTEHKYQGSYEQIGKVITKYSINPGLDMVNFYELLIFSYLTGNADMHLKNFSLIDTKGIGYQLSPAYDLVSTALIMPADNEELALALNGKKKKIAPADFVSAMATNGIPAKAQQNILKKMAGSVQQMLDLISNSFLDMQLQENYKEIIIKKAEKMKLDF